VSFSGIAPALRGGAMSDRRYGRSTGLMASRRRCAAARWGRAVLVALAWTATCATATPLRADEPAPRGATADDLGASIAVRVENGNHRSFRHEEPTTGELRTYQARVYGGIGIALGYERPIDDAQVWSSSLHVDYFRSLLFTSGARRLGETVDTTAQRGSLLAGFRWHPGGAAAPSIGAAAGFSAMDFEFDMPEADTDDDREMQLATGDYTLLQAGLAGHATVWRFGLALHGSYLHGLRAAWFGSREPGELPRGFDALATVHYRLLPWLDLLARANVTALWLRLAPLAARPGDEPARVRDLYLSFGVGGRARF
jgi:hypothetical protein